MICETCIYRNQDEYHKPCIVYRDNCEYYEKERENMTDDLISRQAVQDYIAKYLSQYLYEDVRQTVEVIDEFIGGLPSVNPQEPSETIHGSTYGGVSWGGTYKPQEPKTGHWIKTISENGITSAVRCSECGFEDNRYMLFTYCPNCGAKMSEVKE